MTTDIAELGSNQITTNKEVAQSIVDYFSAPETRIVTEQVTRRDGEIESIDRIEYRPMPMIEEWCASVGITRRMLERLAETSEDIQNALDFARDTLKVYLVRRGLSKEYDPSFATFVATNEVNMKVKSEVTHKQSKSDSDILKKIESSEESI